MKLIRGLINIPHEFSGCVATIGNFDGIHLGHQELLNQLKKKAIQMNLPSLLITFEPQPNEFFMGHSIPPRLMRLREKLSALQELDVDYVLCLHFDNDLAHLSAEKFVQEILVDRLKIAYVLVGDDFRFGYARKGNIQLLKQCGQKYNFLAEAMETYFLDGQRVSSTLVRLALEAGNLKVAESLLGRHYRISGRVAHGDKRGRILGFPTANIFLHRKVIPVQGIFAVKTYGLSENPIYGVASVGNRPTVGGKFSLLEVHLFDFNRDIYGLHIDVEFVHKLRDERRFDSLPLLQQQILKDAEEAREYFNIPSP